MIHRILVGVLGIFLIRFTLIAWRVQRKEKLVLTFVTSLTILFFGQAFIGALLSLEGNVDSIGILRSLILSKKKVLAKKDLLLGKSFRFASILEYLPDQLIT